MTLYRDCCCEFCGLTSILLDARFSQVYSFVCNTVGSNYTLYPNGLGTSRNLNVPGTDVTMVRSVNPSYPGGSGQLYPYFWATVPSAEPWTGYSLANCAGSCAWLAYHGARISMEKHNGASPGYWACTLTMFHRWQKPASGPCGPSGVSSFEVFATQHLFVDYALCPIGTWGEDSWVDVFGVTRTVTTGAAKIGGGTSGLPVVTFGAKSGSAVTA